MDFVIKNKDILPKDEKLSMEDVDNSHESMDQNRYLYKNLSSNVHYTTSDNNHIHIMAYNIDSAVESILELYTKSDVCIGEFLESIEIHGLDVSSIVQVYARLYNTIEGDVCTRTEEDGTIHLLE